MAVIVRNEGVFGIGRAAVLIAAIALGSCTQPFNVIRDRTAAPVITGSYAESAAEWWFTMELPYPEEYKMEAARDPDFRDRLDISRRGARLIVRGEDLGMVYFRAVDPYPGAVPSDVVSYNVPKNSVNWEVTFDDVMDQFLDWANHHTIDLYGRHWDHDLDASNSILLDDRIIQNGSIKKLAIGYPGYLFIKNMDIDELEMDNNTEFLTIMNSTIQKPLRINENMISILKTAMGKLELGPNATAFNASNCTVQELKVLNWVHGNNLPTFRNCRIEYMASDRARITGENTTITAGPPAGHTWEQDIVSQYP
ncbi:MAG: hypothetical protein LBD31_02195 [Treponema sp.]|nr:hypothetical protein [Treponema sp.]